MEKLIAVVDDEEDILELVSLNIKKAGYRVKGYKDGDSFLKSLKKTHYDLIILDLMMPGVDGLEVCKTMKSDTRHKSIPIIMLTAKTHETDKVLGLELGADDYITKPFSPRELVARVKAVLRRFERAGSLFGDSVTELGSVTIDMEKHEVKVKGKRTELTATEFRILQILASKSGRVFSREQLLDNLWGNEKAVVDRTIDVHIKHLREKLGTAGKMVKNVRGVGYKIDE